MDYKKPYTIVDVTLLIIGTLFVEVKNHVVRVGQGFISQREDHTKGKVCHSPKNQFKLTKEETQALYNKLGQVLKDWDTLFTDTPVDVTTKNVKQVLGQLDLQKVFYQTAIKLPPGQMVSTVKEYIAAGIPFKEDKPARAKTKTKPKVTKKSKVKDLK